MKKLKLILAISLLASYSYSQKSLQLIKGIISDQQTKLPLIGANVKLMDSPIIKGVVTDINGQFQLEAPIGRQKLVVSYIGYESLVMPNILVTTGKEVVLDIKLEETITELSAVTVSSKLPKGNQNNSMATISSRSFSLEEVTRFAGTVNDISRMAANFAGVFIPDNERNDIIIRGNSPLGLLWRLEGVPIGNPNHFSTLGATGGVISAVNPNMLKNSDFLTGAFPAEYGNTTSGVFDLALRTGNKDNFEFTTQLAAFSGLELTTEGPLNKEHTSSFLVGYRHSFLELLDVFNLSIGLSDIPKYKDLSFHIDFAKNKFGKFSIFGLGGLSNITFDDPSEREVSTSKLGTIGLNHRYLLDNSAYVKTTLAFSGSEATYQEYNLENEDWKMDFENKDVNNKIVLTSYYHKKINPRWNIRVGVTNELYLLDVNSNDWDNGEHETIRDYNGALGLLQTYAQTKYKFSSKLTANAGLHVQYLTLNQSIALEPRVTLNYTLSPIQTISLGYGLHSQMQALPIYFYETEIAPNEYIRTNEKLDFSRSHHFILGYDLRLNNSWNIKVDAYYQSLIDIPVETESSYFSTLNIGADFDFPDEDYLVNQGSGKNYGIELTVEKFFDNSWYGLLSMSLSDSKYKGSDNVTRNTAFNNGYIVNLLAGKEFGLSKKNDNKLTFDLKLTNAGGRYFTPIDLETSRLVQTTVRDYASAFEGRYAPYFRLDTKIGYRINSKHKKFYQHFFVEFQNITNRRNPLNNYYSQSRDQIRTKRQLGFFFDILYRVQF
jgi:hypothetical protein